MKRKYVVYVLALFIIPVLSAKSFARVEWDIQKVLKLDAPPLDIAIPDNGNSIFILSKSGKILIYSFDGRLKDEIDIGAHVDKIKAGPSEEWLFLISSKNKTVEILHVDFVKHIDISGSPFRGPKNAPIVIAVFSDFQ
ncbi:MAG: hypothetical protein P8012_10050 [Desulfobacterales bacterium]